MSSFRVTNSPAAQTVCTFQVGLLNFFLVQSHIFIIIYIYHYIVCFLDKAHHEYFLNTKGRYFLISPFIWKRRWGGHRWENNQSLQTAKSKEHCFKFKKCPIMHHEFRNASDAFCWSCRDCLRFALLFITCLPRSIISWLCLCMLLSCWLCKSFVMLRSDVGIRQRRILKCIIYWWVSDFLYPNHNRCNPS